LQARFFRRLNIKNGVARANQRLDFLGEVHRVGAEVIRRQLQFTQIFARKNVAKRCSNSGFA
jgi:hypothetical protein